MGTQARTRQWQWRLARERGPGGYTHKVSQVHVRPRPLPCLLSKHSRTETRRLLFPSEAATCALHGEGDHADSCFGAPLEVRGGQVGKSPGGEGPNQCGHVARPPSLRRLLGALPTPASSSWHSGRHMGLEGRRGEHRATAKRTRNEGGIKRKCVDRPRLKKKIILLFSFIICDLL